MSTDTESGLQPCLNDDEFVCPHCSKRLSNKHGLIRHIRTHTGDKPFTCIVCSKSFADRQYLVLHTRMHTGERPYSCDQCDKRFSSQSNLIQHSKVHKGVRPYKCPQCLRRFTQLSGLKCHLRTHTGERPFPCNICGRRFAQLTNMKKHQASHMEGVDENGYIDGYEYQHEISEFKGEDKEYYPSHMEETGEQPMVKPFENNHEQYSEQYVDNSDDQLHLVDADEQKNLIQSREENFFHSSFIDVVHNTVQEKLSISQNTVDEKPSIFRNTEDGKPNISQNTVEEKPRISESFSSPVVEIKRHKVRNASKIMAVANALGGNVYDTIASVMPESDEEFSDGDDEYYNYDNYDNKADYIGIPQDSIDNGSVGVSFANDYNPQIYKSGKSDLANISDNHNVGDVPSHSHSVSESAQESRGQYLSVPDSTQHSLSRSQSISESTGQCQYSTDDGADVRDQSQSGLPSASSSEALRRTVSGADDCLDGDGTVEDQSDSEEMYISSDIEMESELPADDNPDYVLDSANDLKIKSNTDMQSVDIVTHAKSEKTRLKMDANDLAPDSPNSRTTTSLPLINSPSNILRHSRSNIDASLSSPGSVSHSLSYNESTESRALSYTSPGAARPWSVNRAPIGVANSSVRRRGRPPRLQLPLGGEVVGSPNDASKLSQKPFRCKICAKYFSTLGNLKQHLNIHSGLKPYVCSVCPRSFSSKGGLLQHTATHTNNRPHVCNICFKGFNQSGNLRTHQRIHTGERPYKCPVCGKGFGNIGNMRTHARTHGHVFPAKDPVITLGQVIDTSRLSEDERNSGSELFLSSHNTRRSRESTDSESEHSQMNTLSPRNSLSGAVTYNKRPDHNSQMINASISSVAYNKRLDLSAQIINASIGALAYIKQPDLSSPMNNASINALAHNKPDLDTQMINAQRRVGDSFGSVKHGVDNLMQSPLAGSVNNEMIYSMSPDGQYTLISTPDVPTSKPQRRFICSVCMKDFSAMSSLEIHMTTHTGEKRYECTTCGRKFAQTGTLKVHMRTHTGEKPFACTVCDKRFSQSGSLDVHLKTHLPDRYPCEKCGEKFPRMMSLRQHDLTVHCDYLSSDESKPIV